MEKLNLSPQDKRLVLFFKKWGLCGNLDGTIGFTGFYDFNDYPLTVTFAGIKISFALFYPAYKTPAPMRYTPQHTQLQNRSGVILLVLLVMLTLLAIVGVTFLYYADSSSYQARLFKEADPRSRTASIGIAIDPDTLSSWFFGQLLYDLPDDATGVQSGLRGHSLARLTYGYNDEAFNVLRSMEQGDCMSRVLIPWSMIIIWSTTPGFPRTTFFVIRKDRDGGLISMPRDVPTPAESMCRGPTRT